MTIDAVLKPRATGRRILLRGEPVIASAGLALAAIILFVMAAAALWTLHTQRDMVQESRRREARALAGVIAQSAETMLASNELSPLRRLLVQARTDHGLQECSVVLPNGTVIADGEPAKISRVALPERWPSGPVDAQILPDQEGVIRVNSPLRVEGRGSAMLLLAVSDQLPYSEFWPSQAGLGLIAACGLITLLLVYRQMRTRLRSLSMIREALVATRSGAGGMDALTIAATGGPEVEAWNAMLVEKKTLRDQTLVLRANEALSGRRGKTAEYDQAFDALPLGVVVANPRGEVVFANGAAAACLRRKREELYGQSVADLLPGEKMKQAVIDSTAGAARTRAVVEAEHKDEQSGGVLRFAVRPLRHGGAGGALITIDDVTQQRVADESRNSFIAQATHELRMPLTNMRLYLDAAQENDQDTAMRGKALNVIGQECRRLEQMVGEMLSVAQIEAGSLEINKDDVRLAKLFEELQADYSTTAAEKISLRFEMPPKLPTIQGDREKLMLALHNLVGNALKYSPEGGSVTVIAAADAKSLRIDVRDTGIGIAEEEQDRIFERFYRAKDPRVRHITGSGLGLTLAREVARLHGGDITVQSQPDKGSTFTLTIPVTTTAG
ncbi:MAG: cell wall metabolism sensor histidine kinase WalK [Planctomycetes bacterium]|nr:cell wall metabolism sensor histidine kinase WalK [Planctomycetota bacterium]